MGHNTFSVIASVQSNVKLFMPFSIAERSGWEAIWTNAKTVGIKGLPITLVETGTVPNVTVPPKPPGSPIDSERVVSRFPVGTRRDVQDANRDMRRR